MEKGNWERIKNYMKEVQLNAKYQKIQEYFSEDVLHGFKGVEKTKGIKFVKEAVKKMHSNFFKTKRKVDLELIKQTEDSVLFRLYYEGFNDGKKSFLRSKSLWKFNKKNKIIFAEAELLEKKFG